MRRASPRLFLRLIGMALDLAAAAQGEPEALGALLEARYGEKAPAGWEAELETALRAALEARRWENVELLAAQLRLAAAATAAATTEGKKVTIGGMLIEEDAAAAEALTADSDLW